MNFIQKFKKKGQSFLSFGIKKKNIRFFCAFLAGSLSVCAYPPAYHTSALFFSFSALVYLINEAESKTEAFFSGGLFGGGLSLTSLFYAVTGLYESYSLPVYLFFMSVFFLFCFSFTAIPALLACSYPKGIRRFLAFCVLAALSEWVRTYIFNGSWNLSATVLTKYPSLMQIDSLIGPFGCCFLIYFIFSSPAFLLKKPRNFFPAAAAVLFSVAAYAYGINRLEQARTEYVPGVSLRLAQYKYQPNKGEEFSSFDNPHIFEKFIDFVTKKPLGNTTHVLTPENTFVTSLENEPFLFPSWKKEAPKDITFLTGTVRIRSMEDLENTYNSIIVFNDQKKISHIYDKWKFVPVGEYIPFLGRKLPTLTLFGNNIPGDGAKTFHLKDIPPVAPVSCIEIIFPRVLIDHKDRPQWIANISNETKYLHAPGAAQALAAAQLRAVEEGLPVAKTTSLYGISALINPYGIIEKSLPRGIQDVLDTPLPKALPPTFYSEWGNLPFLVFSFCLLTVCAFFRMPSR